LLIEKTEKQIKLIKEYKTTLINQAVCGRINN
ncbi:restriction endonuclease subunit S, partial [Campylobacter jejuni]|nr:restriction endonuclease subunit S [Campylobacter jejuni]EAH5992009.1 restriction endonuclease subunit S [Campylobacter jejuni]EAH6652502.1 restriction endonuclease subunit S [Campylobacter jejuni]EAH7208791.1 restriction endonuclease subunit S [Campylobacter jejuni]EAI1296759.1 restriction endonuclease subunit S [Campylobacter jejuni]